MMRELYDEIGVLGWSRLPRITVVDAASHPTPEDVEYMDGVDGDAESDSDSDDEGSTSGSDDDDYDDDSETASDDESGDSD